MREGLYKLAGVADPSSPTAGRAALANLCGPLAAPFLILFCEPRWELVAVAACWSLLTVPGVLAVNLLFSNEHPLGRGASRLAVASVAGLLPFGLVSWAGCLAHVTLATVLVVYAAVYVIGSFVLARSLLRRSGTAGAGRDRDCDVESKIALPPLGALAVIAGIALLLAGVACSTLETPSAQPRPDPFAGREHWWHGTVLAAAGSMIAAAGVLWGRRRHRAEVSKNGLKKAAPPRVKRSADKVHAQVSGGVTSGLLWFVALGLTVYVMKAAYALPQRDFRRDAWNSDDVTYVAEAVDYRYGRPLGRYEPTLGTDMPMSPVNLSPLIAPLVAALSWVTGIECAALQHSVLCPLVVLLGASAMAGALAVVFRGNRGAVPLGLIVILMMVCKSWDYERSMVEFTVWRAMQSKSVHLWLIHPLQLATLILMVVRPDRRHLAVAIAVAVVGHMVHPFSTILGAVWCATVVGYETVVRFVGAVFQRKPAARSLPPAILFTLVASYASLGAAYKFQGRLLLPKVFDPAAWPSSGREADEPEETRDLVRDNGRPVLRQEPRILFGYDVLFNFGAAALPLILSVGVRRREWLYVGLLGTVAVAICNFAPLGRLVNAALPTAVLWRARWMLPSLVAIAAVAVALRDALSGRMPKGNRVWTALASPVATLMVLGAFAGMLAMTDSRLVKLGAAPRQLTKFSKDMHGLVELLGGQQAAPFVWGTREVTRELPQLMPNIKMVLSREKIMLPANHPRFREVVLGIREKFQRGSLTADEVKLLLQLYPIDHLVLDQLSRNIHPAAGILRELGWREVGTSGRYRVWKQGVPHA